MGVQELEAELLKLPAADRARIAERLLASLRPPVVNGGPESPKSLADLFEGRLGVIDSGGKDCLEDSGELFTDYLEAKQRAGIL